MSTDRYKKRIETKKKKAKAFLDLIQGENIVKADRHTVPTTSEEKIMQTMKLENSEITTIDLSEGQTNFGEKHIEIDDVLLQCRKVLRERQKAAMKRPKIFLTLDELTRDSPYESSNGVKETPPLIMLDAQQLLLYGLLGNRAPHNIRWCRLLRVTRVSKCVAVILDSVSNEELRDYPDSLPTLRQAFDIEADIVPPEQYGSSVREDLLNVQISLGELRRELTKSTDKHTVEEELKSLKQRRNHLKQVENRTEEGQNDSLSCLSTSDTIKPTVNEHELPGSLKNTDKLDRCDQCDSLGKSLTLPSQTEKSTHQHKQTELLSDTKTEAMESSGLKENNQTMSDSEHRDFDNSLNENTPLDRRSLMLNTGQMLAEGIPLPFGPKVFSDFVFSKDYYDDVTSQSPMFGIDCEMVQTVDSLMDLARVSVVNEKLECVYDTFVKPRARIKNYVTKFSGITKTIMNSCNTYLEEARQCIQNILPPDAILCGQSISGDLKSLKMFHPYIIDTSVIYNLTGRRRMKTGLKRLSAQFLSQDIQNDPRGHSSVEDARATIELVLLKLQNGVDFGDLAWDMPSSISDTIVSLKGDLVQKDVNEKRSENLKRKIPGDSNPETSEMPSQKKLKLSRQIVTGKKTDGEISRHKLFFLGSGEMEFLLNRIQHFNKSGVVIEEVKSSGCYPDNSGVIYMETDKQRYKETVKSVMDKDLVVTNFYSYRDRLESVTMENTLGELLAAKKKCLKKIDKRVGKIMSSLPDCSLFMVILSGRNTYGQPPAKVFCKIIGPLEIV